MKRNTERGAFPTVVSGLCWVATTSCVAGIVLWGVGLRAQETHDHGHEGQTLKTWQAFLQHVESIGRADLIPEGALAAEKPAAGEAEGAPGEEPGDNKAPGHEDAAAHEDEPGHDEHSSLVDLRARDPIKGILFRLSGALLDVDALFAENGGAVAPDRIEEARRKAVELSESEDPYLEVYGRLFAARLDLQEEKYEDALGTLKSLAHSTLFLPLPAREVQHGLVKANRALGDETMAVLELQLLLVSLPPDEVTERAWAKEQLREIRREHEGPLKSTGKSMLSISELLAAEEVGAPTQKEQHRVEEVFEKVVKILEADRCGNCGTPKCPDCGQRQCPCIGGT